MIHITGHLDLDSNAAYTAAMAACWPSLHGQQMTARRSGEPNHGAQSISEYAGLTMPERLTFELIDYNVWPVDFTEPAQGLGSLTESSAMGIIDRHRLGGLVTRLPPGVWVKPVGSNAAPLWQLMTEDEHNRLSPAEAILLLGAILSDTVTLHSPMTVTGDRLAVDALAQKTGVDPNAFSRDLLSAKISVEGMSTRELPQRDIKTFIIRGHLACVARLELYALQQVDTTLDDLRQEMARYAEEKNVALAVLMFININLGNTNLWFAGSGLPDIPRSCKVEGMLSREKQILPRPESHLKPRQQILFASCMGGKFTRGHIS